ncbi:hypothetical protein ABFS82_10G053500 [Erythranthe guttata]|uniref:Bifunctional inhibitor/plant lipid transfer protein/seed storage helical domain-containing protein n=1 Tax=Erythranthe guttata TaxID=4155 RepID=A0A022R9C6_ERYGU|nr:PREDICTED: 2S albumin-like [Erythranthe guttata]EYU35490.1 hypothetical protein MIMGU_mgv1a015473mg [Erythranthe guttata]|eukprot:XP_012839684.1 PREDICTED: 2S albumin-like [Erythranthe guttata]
MANKATLAAALLVALVTLTSATSYTTTVTTTTIDDEATRGEQQECRQHVQGRLYLSCQRYLSQRSQYGGDEEEVVEMTTTGNPKERSQDLRSCCQQLHYVKQQCRCEAIKLAAEEVQQEGGQWQTGELQQVYERARYLPRQCNFRSPQQCQFRDLFL